MVLANRDDPLLNYRYAIEIQGVQVAVFLSCTGVELKRDFKEVEEGGINDHVHILPGRIKHGNLTLKRGITHSDLLWKWFQAGAIDGKVIRHNLSIILYAPDGKKAKQWDVLQAYPLKWVSSELKSDSQEIAVETIELVHEGINLGQVPSF